MRSALLVMSSMTEANKAKYHLNRMRINSVVEKISTRNAGCSYGVRVYDDPEKICHLLELIDVKCTEIRYGNEGAK